MLIDTELTTLGVESGGCMNNTSFSSYLTNVPNKVECFSLASLSGQLLQSTRLLGPFLRYEEDEVW